jgi:hypothetical protein
MTDPLPGGPPGDDDDTYENPKQRWDRRFAELLQEIRVAQTGGQLLFAFLLTLPFSARFDIDGFQLTIYILTLLASSISMALLIAPVSYHRQVFRQGRKPRLVKTASNLAQAGLAALLIALSGALFLVLDVVAGHRVAGILGGAVALLYTLLWYVLPMVDHRAGDDVSMHETP